MKTVAFATQKCFYSGIVLMSFPTTLLCAKPLRESSNLRHWRLSAIMTTMNQVQQYFSCLVELSRDTGLIGQVLRKYQDLLPAADKWAEQSADYKKKKEDLNRLPVPDPWQFLIDAPSVPEQDKAIFRAAQSQLVALRHLGRMRMGIATLETDWHQEALQARSKGQFVRANHAANKVANGLWEIGKVSESLLDHAKTRPGLLASARSWQKRRRAQQVHSGNWDDSQPLKCWPPYETFREQNKLQILLAEWWVRQGVNGAPGFMFWRNEALTKYLYLCSGGKPSSFIENREKRCNHVKDKRQLLKLVPVGNATHFVWDISIKVNENGDFYLVGFQRNGEKAFSGTIPKKYFPPVRLPALTARSTTN